MHHTVKHDPTNVPAHWDATTARAINGLRVLAAEMVQEANSGHPGAPMGMAPMAYTLYTRFMRHDPAHPHWINRDRFVLSNGHACALLYSVLHLSGYHFTLDDLKAFRKVGSKTPGHPETGTDPKFDGIEVTTGPLGQGLSSAVGIALAERHMAATFNQPGFELFDSYTYVFCGDGCLQEGITSEASSLAGHLGLGKLIVMYDSNQITIDGETDLSFTENVGERYRAYGWQVLEVEHGNGDLEGLARAIEQARADRERPSMIIVKTTIGFGAAKQGTEAVHGSPLGAEDLANVKKLFGFDPAAKFAVPKETYDAFDARKKGAEAYAHWQQLFAGYEKAFPAQAAELSRRMARELPKDWRAGLPKYTPEGKPEATRVSGGLVLNALAAKMPEIVGGSADLNPSTMTYLKMSNDFQKGSPAGRNIRFGVREHAMAAISNGIATYGALVPFCSTFLNFLGYAVRLACGVSRCLTAAPVYSWARTRCRPSRIWACCTSSRTTRLVWARTAPRTSRWKSFLCAAPRPTRSSCARRTATRRWEPLSRPSSTAPSRPSLPSRGRRCRSWPARAPRRWPWALTCCRRRSTRGSCWWAPAPRCRSASRRATSCARRAWRPPWCPFRAGSCLRSSRPSTRFE